VSWIHANVILFGSLAFGLSLPLYSQFDGRKVIIYSYDLVSRRSLPDRLAGCEYKFSYHHYQAKFWALGNLSEYQNLLSSFWLKPPFDEVFSYAHWLNQGEAEEFWPLGGHVGILSKSMAQVCQAHLLTYCRRCTYCRWN